jgi:hypothetical protein
METGFRLRFSVEPESDFYFTQLNRSIESAITVKQYNQKSGATTMSRTPNTVSSLADDRNAWRWGFTSQAEIWNGRLAMIGFVSAVLIELLSNQGVLHFWNLM